MNSGDQIAARTALAVCGFTAVVGQIVLMRELIQVFNGNEIALGILLATWLLWTAVGSALASGFGRRTATAAGTGRMRLAVAALEALLALSLPATIWAVRSARSFFESVPGELIGPAPMLVTSFVCLGVFCAASGALFVAAARMLDRFQDFHALADPVQGGIFLRKMPLGGVLPGYSNPETEAAESGISARSAVGAAYLLEAAGSALGGLLASLVLVRFCESFQIAAIVGLLNLAAAAALLVRFQRRQLALLALAAALLGLWLVVWAAPRWDAAARDRLWRGFHVVASRDSVYGNLTVTGTGDETSAIAGSSVRSLYENGAILANAPDPAAAEEAVDYALLEHAAPRRVLLIGGGVNGSVAEALKQPAVASLDYVELDPALIQMAQKYFPGQTAVFRPGSGRTDPRVHLHFLDGRRFLTESRNFYDVIIVNIPDPATAQLNRFYTLEFFRLARAHLASGGLVAVGLRSSEETISPDLAAFLRSIRRTLGQVFPYQAAIPGETIHFFGAAEPGVLTQDPQLLVERLRQRHLSTQYVREYFIPYRMSADRMQQMNTLLAPLASTPVNRDFAPVAYAFDVVLWSGQFKSGGNAWFRNAFRAAGRLAFTKLRAGLALALAAAFLLLALLPGSQRRRRAAAAACVAATGFTLMALQIFLLLGFEAVYGYVYTELAILIGLFMAGIAMGSWLGMRRKGANRFQTLPAIQLLLLLSAPASLFCISALGGLSSRSAAWLAAQIVFPSLAALAGMLGGLQFVTAAEIFCSGRNQHAGFGLLYAIDLFGGCAGALALSTVLIPVFGFWPTAWVAAWINVPAVLLAVRSSFN